MGATATHAGFAIRSGCGAIGMYPSSPPMEANVPARPRAAGLRPMRTQAPVFAPFEDSGLPFAASALTSTYDRKAVITQDPNPVSGEQLWSHPPV